MYHNLKAFWSRNPVWILRTYLTFDHAKPLFSQISDYMLDVKLLEENIFYYVNGGEKKKKKDGNILWWEIWGSVLLQVTYFWLLLLFFFK